MKKLLLTTLLSVALVGCGSKDENKTSSGAGSTGGQKVAQDNGTCPNLNGNFDGGGESIFLKTRVVNGVHQYAMSDDENYIPADNQTRSSPDNSSSIRVSCGNQAIEFFVKRTGEKDLDIVITDIGNDQVRAEANGQTVVLTRRGAAGPGPAPGPQPQPQPNPAGNCPVLNGTYSSGTDSVVLATQVQAGVTSYKFSADQQAFLPADGITHQLPDNQGNYRVGCALDGGKPSVSMNVNLAGRDPISVQFTDLGQGNVKATANGQTEMLHKQ